MLRPDTLTGLLAPHRAAALVGYAAAYTPSLLPRPWYFQGLVAGLGAMAAFQSGLLVRSTISLATRKFPPRTISLRAMTTTGRIAGALAGLGATIAIPALATRWQRANADHVENPAHSPLWAVGSAATAAAVFSLLAAQWRFMVWASSHLHIRVASKMTNAILARIISTLTVLATTGLVFDRVLMRGLMLVVTSASARVDLRTPPNVVQPTTELHSGSPASNESWDRLGLQGKRFTCAGPSRERIEEVCGGQAMQPIRAYASMNRRTIPQVVDAVLAEMDRTDAWSRSRILLVTTTGRGNVNEWSASTFEYLTRGDCATVAMQYSGLPSAVTMIADKQDPVRASRLLYQAVTERIAALPAERRPLIYLGGESLGAFGSTGIIDGIEDLPTSAAGAVWTGCPDFSPLQEALIEARDPGSDTIFPVVDGGRHVRFAMTPEQLVVPTHGGHLGPWEFPRYVFLRNETDPVTFWNPRLLWRRPQWLTDMTGTNTPMGRMRWWPFITFWQITSDMPVCRDVRAGFGHKYHAEQCIPAWVAVLGLDPDEDRSAITEALMSDVPPVSP